MTFSFSSLFLSVSYPLVKVLFISTYKIFAKGVDPDTVVLMAARASRLENQDAIDSAIVGMLADPKEVSHFFCSLPPFFICDIFIC